MRAVPTTPNSPREIGVGERAPWEMKPETASKSKVRQAICLAIVLTPRGDEFGEALDHIVERGLIRAPTDDAEAERLRLAVA